MGKQKKIKISDNQLRASFKPETYDEEKRTIDLVWSTGARVKRSSWFDGPYFEELSMEKKSVRMDRLNAGAPVLNEHGTRGYFTPGRGLRDILGVVEKASIRNGEGMATIRFSTRAEVQDIIRDIQEGIIRNVSVGYVVHKYEELEEKQEEAPVYRAIDWEPMEVSFVGMPADMKSQTRSEESSQHEVVLETREESQMKTKAKARSVEESPAEETEAEKPAAEQPAEPVSEPEKEEPAKEEPVKEEPKAEASAEPAKEEPKAEEAERAAEDAKKQIRAEEIQRQSDIRQAVRVAKLDESFADVLVKEGRSVEESRALIFKELEKRTESVTKNHRIEVRDMDQKVSRRDAAVRAMLHRFDSTKYKLESGDNEFRQGSVLDMARHFLAIEGMGNEAYRMSKMEIAKRALHSTSDFPEVLANTANKSLRDAYEGAPNTYEPFVFKKNVSDFKEISSIQLGNGGKLMAVNEEGEYERTTIEESAEKYKVGKFGLILGRTWELLVNDDLDAFTRIPSQLGVRAREKENEIFWGMILANPDMSDGNPYFDAAHGNLAGAGDAISVTSIGVGRAAMRLQTDLEGELMNVAPRYLIVPAAKETLADQFVTQVSPTQASEVNPFANRLKVISEPRLDAGSGVSWYLAADKAQLAAAEMALLDGKGPEMFVREGFEVDGFELKIRYVFGMKMIEHRAMYKNPGA